MRIRVLMFFCSIMVISSYGEILNANHLFPFFEKLTHLEKDKAAGKVNVVHIGDSHVQTNSFSGSIRSTLQQSLGNGGYGFTFPYYFQNKGLEGKTFRFSSNASWQICRNNMPYICALDAEFGLSGYGFTTSMENFALKIEVIDAQYKFNTMKVIAAGEPFPFKIAEAIGKFEIKNAPPFFNIHVVKQGETLAGIAKKYGVSANSIMEMNKIDSSAISADSVLHIHVEAKTVDINMSRLKPLKFQQSERHVATYRQKKTASEIYLIPTVKRQLHNLNGLVFENDRRGIIYHGIGSIGSMASHFNATPLFFEQLHVLSPDLFIVSLGTNESFSLMPAEEYMSNLNRLIANIRNACPGVPVLVTTPPASLLKGEPNIYVKEYTDTLMKASDFAVWNLHSFTDGLMHISGDKMHYTRQGYINQGTAFATAILRNYEQYKQSQKLKE